MKENLEDFLQWDLVTLAERIRKKEISPVKITVELLHRVKAKNDKLNSYITIATDKALDAAKRAEKEINAGNIKGILHGVPIALKDMIFTKDIKTTMGSEIFKSYIPNYDATVVKRLKEAGAIILGKLNTHEFALGGTGDCSYFGAVKNPHDYSKMSGGSSSGSGASVSTFLCYASIGTDTGGSIRTPSSFTGIVGMKPTFGRVSKYGVFPLCYTMDHVGPMTRTVKDNAILLNVLSGYDAKDYYSVKSETEDFTRLIDQDISGSIIGVPSSSYYMGINKDVNEKVKQAIKTLTSLGAQIKEVKIPHMENILSAFRTTLRSESYSVHEQRLSDYPNQWGKEVKNRLLSGMDIRAHEYIYAQKLKQEAIRSYNRIFYEVDVLITPTVPILPANIGKRKIRFNGSDTNINLILNRFTGPINLIGFPAISLPCGNSETGLPIGLQMIGKPFDEANLYRFAYAFEVSDKQ